MIFWILSAIALYTIGLFLPSLLLLPRIGISAYVGSRDNEPEPSALHARVKRAHRNMMESLPVFLALAVLALVVPDADLAQAILGAQVFVLARVAFLPLYLAAVPWARSVAWIAGFVGLIMMAMALI